MNYNGKVEILSFDPWIERNNIRNINHVINKFCSRACSVNQAGLFGILCCIKTKIDNFTFLQVQSYSKLKNLENNYLFTVTRSEYS